MLSENREYHYIGELTLNRSRVFNKEVQPKDDKVNWLFLNTGNNQFSFVYRIQEPLNANYGKPLYAYLAFTMIEAVKEAIQLNHVYEILRGQEIIGTVKLISTTS